DDVGRFAAFETADLRGRLFINAAKFHACDRVGGDGDRGHAFFRRNASVSRFTVDCRPKLRLVRWRRYDASYLAIAIDCITKFRLQEGGVEFLRADQSTFFSSCDKELDIPV